MTRILIAGTAALILLSVEADAQTLETVRITFHVKDDDKDDDTKVWAKVKVGSKTIASLDGFGDGTTYKDWGHYKVKLDTVDKQLTREKVEAGAKVSLKIETVGNDDWRFTYTVTFEFSDGSTIEMDQRDKIHLSRRNNEGEYSVKPKLGGRAEGGDRKGAGGNWVPDPFETGPAPHFLVQ